jgi:hypothetical protein
VGRRGSNGADLRDAIAKKEPGYRARLVTDLQAGLPLPATGHPLAGGVNIIQPARAFLRLAHHVRAQSSLKLETGDERLPERAAVHTLEAPLSLAIMSAPTFQVGGD